MLSQKLQNFDEEIKYLDQTITKATVDLYQTIEKKYLPTPTKIHYVIIIREILFFFIIDIFRHSICVIYHECSKVYYYAIRQS
jgi:hypothetical protein